MDNISPDLLPENPIPPRKFDKKILIAYACVSLVILTMVGLVFYKQKVNSLSNNVSPLSNLQYSSNRKLPECTQGDHLGWDRLMGDIFNFSPSCKLLSTQTEIVTNSDSSSYIFKNGKQYYVFCGDQTMMPLPQQEHQDACITIRIFDKATSQLNKIDLLQKIESNITTRVKLLGIYDNGDILFENINHTYPTCYGKDLFVYTMSGQNDNQAILVGSQGNVCKKNPTNENKTENAYEAFKQKMIADLGSTNILTSQTFTYFQDNYKINFPIGWHKFDEHLFGSNVISLSSSINSDEPNYLRIGFSEALDSSGLSIENFARQHKSNSLDFTDYASFEPYLNTEYITDNFTQKSINGFNIIIENLTFNKEPPHFVPVDCGLECDNTTWPPKMTVINVYIPCSPEGKEMVCAINTNYTPDNQKVTLDAFNKIIEGLKPLD